MRTSIFLSQTQSCNGSTTTSPPLLHDSTAALKSFSSPNPNSDTALRAADSFSWDSSAEPATRNQHSEASIALLSFRNSSGAYVLLSFDFSIPKDASRVSSRWDSGEPNEAIDAMRAKGSLAERNALSFAIPSESSSNVPFFLSSSAASSASHTHMRECSFLSFLTKNSFTFIP